MVLGVQAVRLHQLLDQVADPLLRLVAATRIVTVDIDDDVVGSASALRFQPVEQGQRDDRVFQRIRRECGLRLVRGLRRPRGRGATACFGLCFPGTLRRCLDFALGHENLANNASASAGILPRRRLSIKGSTASPSRTATGEPPEAQLTRDSAPADGRGKAAARAGGRSPGSAAPACP